MQDKTILWRRLDVPGHESVRIYHDEDGPCIDGAAIFLFEGKPCRLEYFIECDDDWNTILVLIDGWVGDEAIEIGIDVEEGEQWFMNEEPVAAVKGCLDIDLNFSPVTNLLPLKRLDLKIGESHTVRAAWLRFPAFELEPLEQTYTRLDEKTVRYESGNGKFVRELKINEAGLVLEYPNFWKAETGG